jgi:hypothetical protein
MRVPKPSLGKYLRRAAATRSCRLELEVTRERARRPISKKGHPRSVPCRVAVGGRGRRNLQAYERTQHRPRGGLMPLVHGLVAVVAGVAERGVG